MSVSDSYSYYKVSDGLAYEVCKQYMADLKALFAQMDSFCEKHGAKKGVFQSCGNFIDGVAFACHPPKGWKKSPHLQGYWVADRRIKEGKVIAQEFSKLRLPTTEDLARNLGCPTFFKDFNTGNQFVGNIGYILYKDVFYLNSHTFCKPDLTKFPTIIKIPASEYFLAKENDEKEQAEKKAAKGG